MTPLHLAASTGNFHIIEELVLWGALIDAQESWGQTPLTVATGSSRIECMRTLLRLGADTEVKDHQHCQTALHVACGTRDEETVLMLLDGGADVHATDKEGLSAVGVAMRNHFYRALPLLLEYGAQPNTADLDYLSPALQGHINTTMSESAGRFPLNCGGTLLLFFCSLSSSSPLLSSPSPSLCHPSSLPHCLRHSLLAAKALPGCHPPVDGASLCGAAAGQTRAGRRPGAVCEGHPGRVRNWGRVQGQGSQHLCWVLRWCTA